MKKSFRTVLFIVLALALAFPLATSANAENSWAVGNLVGLCANTPIHTGSGDSYPIHTYVPEDNWTVKVIDGPRVVSGETWWDTSRAAAGDPSGGTGWVKQNDADSCFGGGGGGGDGDGGGGDSGENSKKYSNPFNDSVSTAEKLDANEAPQPADDGFQWPFSQERNAGKDIAGLGYGAPDSHCSGKLHDGADYDAGDSNYIYAIGNGKVIKVGWNVPGENSGYGLYIVIWHIAPNGENVYSFYGHLYEGTALVSEGQPVSRGQKIARQDTTGGANDISHLHFELRIPEKNGNIWFSSCPATTTDLNNHFYNPVSYIGGDYWWENYSSPRSPSAETLQQDATAITNAIGQENYSEQGTIDNGEITSKKPFWVNAWDAILTIVHKIFGSATEITIYRPDGTIYGVYLVDSPNSLLLTIPDPEPGMWAYSIKGVDIPYENYPYAVSIGSRTEPFLDLSDNLGENPFEDVDGDLIAPTTTLTLTSQNPNGKNEWYVTPVEFSFESSDNSDGVGVAETRYVLNNNHTYIKYLQPVILESEGVNSLGFYSTDGIGNQEPIQNKEIKIDLTPPTVEIDTDQPTYTRVQPFIVHYSGFDPEPGSGLATLTGLFNNQSVTDGQSVDLFWLDLGQYTLSAIGEDYAGWVTTESASIEMVATIESLQQTVDRLCIENYITKAGICKSLQSKLDAALFARERGKAKTAVNILMAFQNALDAQTEKSIQPQAKYLLVMDSNYVIQSLGGKK